MRVLVTWGSKRGGTEGIGRMLGEALAERGIDVVTASAEQVKKVDGFDAVVVGGALYGNRWPGNVRRFVNRNSRRLREVPVWFFSSGPLDDSAERGMIAAPTQIAVLAERVGAKEHITFGGRLEPDAKGAVASAMAKTHAGDWRNPERIRGWAAAIADALPQAEPGEAIDHPARSIPRLLVHAALAWALYAATTGLLVEVTSATAALVLGAIAAPLFSIAVAWHYFRARGARDPLPTALTFAAIAALLDVAVVVAVLAAPMLLASVGVWLPLGLIFAATWATGALMSTLPWPTPEEARAPTAVAR